MPEISKLSPTVWAATVCLSAAAFFFSCVSFDFGLIEGAVLGLLVFGTFWAAARREAQLLVIVILTAWSVSVALSRSFLLPPPGSAGLVIPVTLHPWLIVLISGMVTALAWMVYERSRSGERFVRTLFWVFVLVWGILAVNVKHFSDWRLENVLTVPFVVLIYLTYRAFRLSEISYGLIFVYLVLHVIGSHYTYAEVPFGGWLAGMLEVSRNHYDRIVHFSFGFLLAYPFRELTVRIGGIKGVWGLYMPVEFVLAFSAIYEIIEWLVAVLFGGDLGVAYLGTQGDEWDAIKDMALAGSGAVITMGVVLVLLLAFGRGTFLAEARESLRIKEPSPLGEEALKKLLEK